MRRTAECERPRDTLIEVQPQEGAATVRHREVPLGANALEAAPSAKPHRRRRIGKQLDRRYGGAWVSSFQFPANLVCINSRIARSAIAWLRMPRQKIAGCGDPIGCRAEQRRARAPGVGSGSFPLDLELTCRPTISAAPKDRPGAIKTTPCLLGKTLPAIHRQMVDKAVAVDVFGQEERVSVRGVLA